MGPATCSGYGCCMSVLYLLLGLALSADPFGSCQNEAVASKQMIPIQAYLSSTQSIYHTSWLATPGQILSWGWRQLGLSGGLSGEDKLSVGTFVLLANLEVGRDRPNPWKSLADERRIVARRSCEPHPARIVSTESTRGKCFKPNLLPVSTVEPSSPTQTSSSS